MANEAERIRWLTSQFILANLLREARLHSVIADPQEPL